MYIPDEELHAVLVSVADGSARGAELFQQRRLLLAAVDVVDAAASVRFPVSSDDFAAFTAPVGFCRILSNGVGTPVRK